MSTGVTLRTAATVLWFVHGLLALVGLSAFLLFLTDVGLTTGLTAFPAAGILAAAYLLAIALVLVASVLLGLAVVAFGRVGSPGVSAATSAVASRIRPSPRALVAAFLLFACGGLAGMGILGFIGASVFSESLRAISLALLLGGWAVSSVLLVIASVFVRSLLQDLRKSNAPAAPPHGTWLVIYAALNAGSLMLTLPVLVAPFVASLPGAVAPILLFGALTGLLVAPVFAIVSFGLLAREGLRIRKGFQTAVLPD